jgi:hypothetical protein
VWAADADIVNQAEALMRSGRYAEAFELLEPLEDKLAGDLRYDYLLARAALEMGDPSRATFVYERLLAVEPNFPGVRLEMGRAYYLLGDYARAKLEFETLLRFPNLPPDLRQQATIYAQAVEERLAGKRTVGVGYIEYGYGYDSNPQSITSVNRSLPPPATRCFWAASAAITTTRCRSGASWFTGLPGRFPCMRAAMLDCAHTGISTPRISARSRHAWAWATARATGRHAWASPPVAMASITSRRAITPA